MCDDVFMHPSVKTYWERKARRVHVYAIIVVNTLQFGFCSNMFSNFSPVTKSIHFNALKTQEIHQPNIKGEDMDSKNISSSIYKINTTKL